MTNLPTSAAAGSMSKKDLLPVAKLLDIKGRDSMPATELRTMVVELLAKIETKAAELAPKTDDIDPAHTDAVKKTRRAPSSRERDSMGRVIRLGRNLSGNMPFKAKFYFLDKSVATGDKWQAALAKAPMQARLIIRAMDTLNITDPGAAETGESIVNRAKSSGIVASKIGSAALYAYYARLLETLGVREAGGE